MSIFVMIAGGWRGAWSLTPLARKLEEFLRLVQALNCVASK